MNIGKKGRIINDAELSQISGGVTGESSHDDRVCPICSTEINYSRNTRYLGGNIALYKCPKCCREYSSGQLNGSESLLTDYTDIGDDSFGKI